MVKFNRGIIYVFFSGGFLQMEEAHLITLRHLDDDRMWLTIPTAQPTQIHPEPQRT